MKQSEIKTDHFYTNGKTVRRIRCFNELDPNFVHWENPMSYDVGDCQLKTMARWAKYEVSPCWTPVWPNVKKMDIKEFVECGFLFELNRAVLHPMGLAMYITNSVGGPTVLGGIIDSMDDPDGFVYEPKTFSEGKEKWGRFMKLEGGERLNERRERLGFVKQTTPEQGDV